MVKKVREHWRPAWEEWRKLHANFATDYTYTQCATERSGRQRLLNLCIFRIDAQPCALPHRVASVEVC